MGWLLTDRDDWKHRKDDDEDDDDGEWPEEKED